MLKKIFVLVVSCFLVFGLRAQDPEGNYNPYVNSGNIDPSPLETAEAGGTALFSFLIGNSGRDPLIVAEGQTVIVTIRLSRGVPSTQDPLGSIGGTARNWFNWSYSNSTYTGTQTTNIAANASGTITISYRVTENSTADNPRNGFRADLTPADYQKRSNTGSDDSISVYTYTQCTPPPAPVPGTITQPTCQSPTGTVVLDNLPTGVTWTLTRYPGGTTSTGTGSSATVTGLAPGTYAFTVTPQAGCESARSSDVVINAAPAAPSAPVIGTITQPTCTVSTGSIAISGLPAGAWILTRNPGGATINGSGTGYTDSGLAPGTYTYTVSNEAGCTSSPSQNAVINSSGGTPPAPTVRVDCLFGSGFASVTITSPVGNGYEYRLDNGNWSGSRTFLGVNNGTHTVSVRNSSGCITTGSAFTVNCGCMNRPLVSLSSRSGSTCSTDAVTVSGNTFGGSATLVTITENGAGTVTPSTANSSPFSFTYTPAPGDAGNIVTITVTTNNPNGGECVAAVATYELAVTAVPSAPVAGTVTQPSCTTSTGSVVLNGLPSGNWTLTRNPGNQTTNGNGTSTTVTGLQPGAYTFTVAQNGCVSSPSSEIRINDAPLVPSAPVIGNIIQPTCTSATGSIQITGLPAQGQWTLIRNPGNNSITGTGAAVTIPNLPSGTYTFAVTGATGCTSSPSSSATIRPQPVTPTPPVPGEITAPTCPNPTGRLVLSGLPPDGVWTINSIPAGVTRTGRGNSTTVPGILPGNYTFTVTSSSGCTSGPSTAVVIPEVPNAPSILIHNPDPVCAPSTIDITAPAITAGSTPGLTYTYWQNQSTTIPVNNPQRVGNGIYFIRGTDANQCSDVEPVAAVVNVLTRAQAGPDQELDYVFTAQLQANNPQPGETGTWIVTAGNGVFDDPDSSFTTVSRLAVGENLIAWTLSNGACPPTSDTLMIIVTDLTIPTLITPNDDGRNDFFILRGIETFPENDLRVFDRRGVLVYKNADYMNDWNGLDYNGNPLPPDTYFFVLTTGDGRSRSGYLVIRR